MGRLIDLAGKQFGKWKVICKNTSKPKYVYWFCECVCGNEKLIRADALLHGQSKSCGCSKTEKADISGNVYGRWTAVKRAEHGSKVYFLCRCECGVEKEIRANELKTGLSKSCGCIQKLPGDEAARRFFLSTYKHSAKKRGHLWELTEDIFNNLTRQNCYYCGAEPRHISQSYYGNLAGTFKTNGVDRKDNKIGYTVDNSTACCSICNMAKHTRNTEEFLNWIKRVYEHQSGK